MQNNLNLLTKHSWRQELATLVQVQILVLRGVGGRDARQAGRQDVGEWKPLVAIRWSSARSLP